MLFTEELKSLLKDSNTKLREKYESQSNLSNDKLKQLISSKIGKFINLTQLNDLELKNFSKDKAIVGVDGSVNTQGKIYPHYITLLQALAKSTDRKQSGVIRQQIFSPLIEDDKRNIIKKLSIANNQEGEDNRVYAQEVAGKIKSSLLASLEVLVAKDSILKWNPTLVMMDGSLTRYQNQAEKEWEELVEIALDRDVIIVGVIEEIGTHDLSLTLGDENDFPTNMKDMYDRELMFGLLDLGEMMIFDNVKDGLKKSFARISNDPGVIGIDLLKEQEDSLELVSNLVYSLTPKDGRGIPIWLDIVDEEVRISNKMMEMIIDNYLDPRLKQRLFYSKRSDRVY
ncbi:DNA double-strand break repair nuclease NurA [Orenia marismortui]|uniref:DNA double-strand break repair nuclease NurA n=1 Tax=Orenia marismortui TaxID=46469 RepID=UPI0003665924|nr:DNA double-strand break repair nuclease NurA [Orenia marismortui]